VAENKLIQRVDSFISSVAHIKDIGQKVVYPLAYPFGQSASHLVKRGFSQKAGATHSTNT
jgi:hypothetical protein